MLRAYRVSLQVLAAVYGMFALCSFLQAQPQQHVTFRQYRTTVAPEPGETLQDRCYYQLLLPVADRPVRSTLVIFERGWQLGNLYYDPVFVDFVRT